MFVQLSFLSHISAHSTIRSSSPIFPSVAGIPSSIQLESLTNRAKSRSQPNLHTIGQTGEPVRIRHPAESVYDIPRSLAGHEATPLCNDRQEPYPWLSTETSTFPTALLGVSGETAVPDPYSLYDRPRSRSNNSSCNAVVVNNVSTIEPKPIPNANDEQPATTILKGDDSDPFKTRALPEANRVGAGSTHSDAFQNAPQNGAESQDRLVPRVRLYSAGPRSRDQVLDDSSRNLAHSTYDIPRRLMNQQQACGSAQSHVTPNSSRAVEQQLGTTTAPCAEPFSQPPKEDESQSTFKPE